MSNPHTKVTGKKERQEVYTGIALSLQDNGISQKDQTTDAHLFLSVVIHDENNIELCGGVEGGEEAMSRLLGFFLRDKASPVLVKAFLTAAANHMVGNYGSKAEAIGFLLGNFVEEEMGGIECNCDSCRAKRDKAKTDINVN